MNAEVTNAIAFSVYGFVQVVKYILDIKSTRMLILMCAVVSIPAMLAYFYSFPDIKTNLWEIINGWVNIFIISAGTHGVVIRIATKKQEGENENETET